MQHEILLLALCFILEILQGSNSNEVILPNPDVKGKKYFEETLNSRRTVRSYNNKPITLNDLAQLLWAGQGITSHEGLRTAPSAGALYPLEIYAVVGNVTGLESAVYKYNPKNHSLKKTLIGDKRKELADAALRQDQIYTAAVDIVITAVYERTAGKYGKRAERYIILEVGHAAQNILLQTQSLGLRACPIGAFYDENIKKLLKLKNEMPLYILAIGK